MLLIEGWGGEFCWGKSCPLQRRKAFLKQYVFMNSDLCVLPSGPTKTCKHTILVCCVKHHAQLSKPGVILNLLSKQTCRGSSEMLRVAFNTVLGHCVVWRPILLQDILYLFQTLIPTHHKPINRCWLVMYTWLKLCRTWVHDSNSANDSTQYTFCCTEYILSSAEAKLDGMGWICSAVHADMHRR